MSFIDFASIKEEIPIDRAIAMLGLDMKEKNGQFRGECPTCKSGGPRALAITPSKNSFYCFGNQKGGDVISLVAHIRETSVKDAAAWLIEHHSLHSSPKEPKETQKLQALSNLESEHEAVSAVGIDTAVAKRLGIGFRTKGAGVGSVMIPIRDEHGTLLTYFGVQELTYIHKDFQPPENVVPFKKKASPA